MRIVIHVKPNARKTKIVDRIDEKTFVVALHAPATEGKANEELVACLHDACAVPKSQIIIVRGHKSRVKYVEVPDGTSFPQKIS